MKTEQNGRSFSEAWQFVMTQLREQLPRALFDAWVADIVCLSADENFFTIGCRNTFTRDWLENGIRSTVSDLLEGMLGRCIDVRFVVITDRDHPGETDRDSADQQENELRIEAAWESLYDQVVQPAKVVVLNAYFLRHLRGLGPELGWMYVGFHQAAYSDGGREGRRTARFSGKSLALLSGTSERTFWLRTRNPETWKRLAGLVTLIDEKPLWDQKSTTPKRLPRKYTVAMTLPLTAVDSQSLIRWIADHLEEAGSAASVLGKACETPLTELIPVCTENPVNNEPMTVCKIVHDLFAQELPELELVALAQRLQLHLMPSRDLVLISLFFIEHILPFLGAGPAWMLTILRDRCFVNPATGESRNRVIVKGGFAEIAGWIGFERPMTIYEWLNGKHRKKVPVKDGQDQKTWKLNPRAGQYLNSGARIYLREVPHGRVLDFNQSQREFEVLMEEIPVEILSAVIQKKPLFNVSGFDGSYVVDTIGFTRITDNPSASCSLEFTHFADHLYATCRVFNLLNPERPALRISLKPTSSLKITGDRSPDPAQEKVVVDEWNLNTLLGANGVSRKKQKELLEAQASGSTFVSWILYAYTQAGRSLTDPVGNAIQSTLATPNGGAVGACKTLARYGPKKLTGLLVDSILGSYVSDQVFLSSFSHLSLDRKQELILRLGEKPVQILERVTVGAQLSPEDILYGERPAVLPENLEDLRERFAARVQNLKNERVI